MIFADKCFKTKTIHFSYFTQIHSDWLGASARLQRRI